MAICLQSIGGMHDELRWHSHHQGGNTNRGSSRYLRSINSGQLVTPTDRILVLGRLRKLDDQRRYPIGPAPDMERTEIVRRHLACRRYFVFAVFAAIVAAVLEMASHIAAGAAPHT